MTDQTYDFSDGNGPVPARRHPNGGGWVADTAFASESVYVGPNAQVFGNARVFGDAQVSENARVYENAQVYGNARISKTPVVLLGFPHIVTITDNRVIVGCENHPPSVWCERGAAIIKADGHTTQQARQWSAIINKLAEAHGCVDKDKTK